MCIGDEKCRQNKRRDVIEHHDAECVQCPTKPVKMYEQVEEAMEMLP
jgi:hypothetical protein